MNGEKTLGKKGSSAETAAEAKAAKAEDILENPAKDQEISPTWAHECIEDLDDWIESQGIYLRQ